MTRTTVAIVGLLLPATMSIAAEITPDLRAALDEGRVAHVLGTRGHDYSPDASTPTDSVRSAV